VNLFLEHKDGHFRLCQIGDDNGPCDNEATWKLHPQGYLQTSIDICSEHKEEAQKEEQERCQS